MRKSTAGSSHAYLNTAFENAALILRTLPSSATLASVEVHVLIHPTVSFREALAVLKKHLRWGPLASAVLGRTKRVGILFHSTVIFKEEQVKKRLLDLDNWW